MHPYRVILCTGRFSYVLSKITDNPNAITHQSIGTDDDSREPLYGPGTNAFKQEQRVIYYVI